MRRYLILAVPLLVLTLAIIAFAQEQLSGGARQRAVTALSGRPLALPPGSYLLATWVLEAIGLTALFLLVQRRGRPWWLDGAMTGGIAWVFRGPLLVVTVVGLARVPRAPWWSLSVGWLVAYLLCGLVLARLALALEIER